MAQIELGIDVDTRDVTTADAAFDRLKGELQDLTREANAVAGATQRMDRAVRDTADAARQAEQRTGAAVVQLDRMRAQLGGIGPVAQNAGRQMQDFIIQVQAGGSVMQALSFQLPQFLDSFGAVGAIAGTVAAVALPALAIAMRSLGAETASLEDQMDSLNDALKALESAASLATFDDLVETYGRVDQAVLTLIANLKELAAQQAATAATAVIDTAFADLMRFREAPGVLGRELGQVVGELETRFKLAREEADRLREAMAAAQNAQGFDAQLQALIGVLDTMQAISGTNTEAAAAMGELRSQVVAAANMIAKARGEAEQMDGAIDGAAASSDALAGGLSAAEQAAAAAAAQIGAIGLMTDAAAVSVSTLTAGWAAAASQIGAVRSAWADAAADAERFSTATNQATLPGGGIHSETGDFPLFKNIERAAATAKDFPVYFREAANEADRLGAATGRAGGGASKVAGSTKDAANQAERYRDILGQVNDGLAGQQERWDRISQGISESLRGLAFGTMTGAEGIGGAISALTDGAFGEALDTAFNDAAKEMAKTFGNSLSGLNNLGLSDFAVASVGTGIGIAVTGVLNGDAKQIGGGIGSAIGGALGSSLTSSMGGLLGTLGGPLGMILGGLAGGALSGIFGGGRDYVTPEGTAFQGTPIERRVRALEAFPVDDGNTGAAHIAYAGVVETVREFEEILNDLIKGVTASSRNLEVDLREGIDVMKAVDLITLELDRRPTSSVAKGAEERAQRFQERMLEIVDIAQRIATAGAAPLTQAQAAWRAFQEQFSEENVEILKAIGFSARQIREAQREIGRELVGAFNKEMLDTIVDLGGASEGELRRWLNAEMAALEEWRDASLATAREIGASTDLVRSAFRGQARDIRREFREMLEDMAGAVEETATRMERLQFRSGFLGEITGSPRATRPEMREWFRVQSAILEEQRRQAVREARQMGVEVGLVNRAFRLREVALERQYRDMLGAEAERARERELAAAERQAAAAQRRIDTLQGRLNGVEQQRANVLQELTRRAEEARRAEQTLADARASLMAGELAPGGPLDRLAELQRQFGSAIRAARGGDADAASRAAGLAQTLLQQGQQVYASGGAYVDLFRMVNEQLASVQGRFDNRADRIEERLDASTFTSVTEKSTAALLRGLAKLDERLAELGDRIDAQTRRLETTQQVRRAGRGAA